MFGPITAITTNSLFCRLRRSLRILFEPNNRRSQKQLQRRLLTAHQLPRLKNMRLSKPWRREFSHLADLISQIHFDGNLTMKAHSGEKDGTRFWSHALEGFASPTQELNDQIKARQAWKECPYAESIDPDEFWLQQYRMDHRSESVSFR
jgi:hypothetical protein